MRLRLNAEIAVAVAIGGIAVAAGALAAWGISAARAINVDEGAPVSVIRYGPIADSALTWTTDFDTAPWSITSTMGVVEDAFEAVVTTVSDARFNTPTGLPPATGDPNSDDEDVEAAWMLVRYVTLDITHRYKGDQTIERAVVVARGGEYDENNDGLADYVEQVRGLDFVDAEVGDEYVVYGLYPFTVPPNEVEADPWERSALDLAEQLSQTGPPTVYLAVWSGYKVVNGVASSHINHNEFDIAVLRQLTEDLSGR